MSEEKCLELKRTIDHKKGIIGIETHYPKIDGLMRQVHRDYMYTKERLVREGLVALGWTPPSVEDDK